MLFRTNIIVCLPSLKLNSPLSRVAVLFLPTFCLPSLFEAPISPTYSSIIASLPLAS